MSITKAQVQTSINTNIPDNTTGLVTPAKERQAMNDILDYSSQFDSAITFINPDLSGSSVPGFTPIGSPSYTVSGGMVNFSGVGASDYTKYIRSNEGVMMDKCSITIPFILHEIGVYGVGIGFESYNQYGYAHSIRAAFVANSGDAHFGKCVINGIYGTATNTNVNINDSFEITLEKDNWKYSLIIKNITQEWQIRQDMQITNYANPISGHNSSYVSIYHLGGSVSVSSIKYTVNTNGPTDMINVGDSITYGQAATDETLRYVALTGNASSNIGSGGGADVTASVVARLNEIIAIKPRRVTSMIGGNDILFGVSSSTWQTNYSLIRNTLVDAGIEVIHLTPTPRNSTDVTPLRTYIYNTFPGDQIIDTYTALASGSTLNPTYDSGDGVHPNNAGQRKIAETINNALGFITPGSVSQNTTFTELKIPTGGSFPINSNLYINTIYNTLRYKIDGIIYELTGSVVTEGYTTLEDKVFTSAGSWTLTNSTIANDGGIDKLFLNNTGTYSVGFKQGIYTVGDILRVTVSGVNNVSGQIGLALGDSDGNQYRTLLSNGSNQFTIDTTGFPDTYIILYAPSSGNSGYAAEILIEKQI